MRESKKFFYIFYILWIFFPSIVSLCIISLLILWYVNNLWKSLLAQTLQFFLSFLLFYFVQSEFYYRNHKKIINKMINLELYLRFRKVFPSLRSSVCVWIYYIPLVLLGFHFFKFRLLIHLNFLKIIDKKMMHSHLFNKLESHHSTI